MKSSITKIVTHRDDYVSEILPKVGTSYVTIKKQL